MSKPIKEFLNGGRMMYVKGRFDAWMLDCKGVEYLSRFPRDEEIFELVISLAKQYGPANLLGEFNWIFWMTDSILSSTTLRYIESRGKIYGQKFEIVFTFLYLSMVAEENKTHAPLGKRMKMLGIYQVLIEGADPFYASQFSKGKKVQELNEEMRKRGF